MRTFYGYPDVKIYVCNLGMYNDGHGVDAGDWLTLPVDEDDFKKFLIEKCFIGTTDEFGQPYEEWFITDYDYDLPFKLYIGEYENIMALSELVEELGYFHSSELESIGAYMECYSNNLEEAMDTIRSGRYMHLPFCKNYEDLGEHLFQNSRFYEKIPADFRDYINYEKFGKYNSENGTISEIYGYFESY